MANTPDDVISFEALARLIWIAFAASRFLDAVLNKEPLAEHVRELAVDLDKMDDDYDEDSLTRLGQNLGDYSGFRGELLDDPPRLCLRKKEE